MPEDNRKSSRARRRLLKTISTGGGVIVTGKMLPGKWVAPVVESVVLPAHAETSLTTTAAPTTPAPTTTPVRTTPAPINLT